jgi:undecaprenyl diphosphate synthase
MNSIPCHLGIIMDGNRRWAERRGKSAKVGHENGSSIIHNIAQQTYHRGVSWLTLFAFSTENWQRSDIELMGIMSVLRQSLKKDITSLIENNVRLRQVGNLAGFPDDIINLIHQSIEQSCNNTGLNVTIALGYGGQADLVAATKQLAEKVKAGEILADDITADCLKSHLSTADLPPIDLLLRTGNEQRISNFLLWDIAYAEMVFSPVLWPDFSANMLDQILDEYATRVRRFGGNSIRAEDNQDNQQIFTDKPDITPDIAPDITPDITLAKG